MKGLTPSSFGLLIAFLLPGLLGVLSVTFWSDTVAQWVASVRQAGTNLDHLSLLLLLSLASGLELTIVRWVIFEKIICRGYELPPNAFEMLSDEHTLPGFRTAIEEHYRYHQFWGSTAVALPVGFAGWLNANWVAFTWKQVVLVCSLFFAVEILTVFAAVAAFRLYVSRGRAILVRVAQQTIRTRVVRVIEDWSGESPRTDNLDLRHHWTKATGTPFDNSKRQDLIGLLAGEFSRFDLGLSFATLNRHSSVQKLVMYIENL